jgi:hypothetical protein
MNHFILQSSTIPSVQIVIVIEAMSKRRYSIRYFGVFAKTYSFSSSCSAPVPLSFVDRQHNILLLIAETASFGRRIDAEGQM